MWITSIAWECPIGYLGGLGTTISRLLPALRKFGNVVHLCTEGSRRLSYKYSGVLVVPWCETVFDPGNAVGFAEGIVLSEACFKIGSGSDVVVSHDFHASMCLTGLAGRGVRLVHFVHLPTMSPIDTLVFQLVDKLVANSRKTAEIVANYTGRKPDVVYLPSPYSMVKRVKPFRKRTRIVIFGRYQEFKDPSWVFDKLNELWRRRGGFSVVVLGKGTEVLRDRYSYPWLVVKGGVDEKAKIDVLMNSDLMLYPVKFDPYGLVALESISLGTPALVSTGAGVSEVLPDGVFDHENVEKLVDLLEKYVGCPECLERLLEAQRSGEIFGKKWVDVARELLG